MDSATSWYSTLQNESNPTYLEGTETLLQDSENQFVDTLIDLKDYFNRNSILFGDDIDKGMNELIFKYFDRYLKFKRRKERVPRDGKRISIEDSKKECVNLLSEIKIIRKKLKKDFRKIIGTTK